CEAVSLPEIDATTKKHYAVEVDKGRSIGHIAAAIKVLDTTGDGDQLYSSIRKIDVKLKGALKVLKPIDVLPALLHKKFDQAGYCGDFDDEEGEMEDLGSFDYAEDCVDEGADRGDYEYFESEDEDVLD
ncbi:unnamed protein product, partial [Prorocentrum cordatum]